MPGYPTPPCDHEEAVDRVRRFAEMLDLAGCPPWLVRSDPRWN